jgi:hypothetical protein
MQRSDGLEAATSLIPFPDHALTVAFSQSHRLVGP